MIDNAGAFNLLYIDYTLVHTCVVSHANRVDETQNHTNKVITKRVGVAQKKEKYAQEEYIVLLCIIDATAEYHADDVNQSSIDCTLIGAYTDRIHIQRLYKDVYTQR